MMRVSVNGKPLVSKTRTGGSIPSTRAFKRWGNVARMRIEMNLLGHTTR